jgi:hypothetical protein
MKWQSAISLLAEQFTLEMTRIRAKQSAFTQMGGARSSAWTKITLWWWRK